MKKEKSVKCKEREKENEAEKKRKGAMDRKRERKRRGGKKVFLAFDLKIHFFPVQKEDFQRS